MVLSVTFSSWPVSALVAGEKIGTGKRSLSTIPTGSSSPASVPEARYSFQADPVMYPRTTHSKSTGSVRRTSMALPEILSRCWSSAVSSRAISSASALRKWFGPSEANFLNQNALSWVRTAPFQGTASFITTSNALTRSLATSRRRASSIS